MICVDSFMMVLIRRVMVLTKRVISSVIFAMAALGRVEDEVLIIFNCVDQDLASSAYNVDYSWWC